MSKGTWALCLFVQSVAACGGTAQPPNEESAPPNVQAHAVAAASMESLVGLWDDCLGGENTKLDLRADGSAHIVSLAVVPATWTFEAKSLRVTVTSRRQRDGSTVLQHVTYAPGGDVLTGRFFGPGGSDHVFRRASQEAIDWWAKVRPRVEADEVLRRDSDRPAAPGGR
jgi:hypothetical protein